MLMKTGFACAGMTEKRSRHADENQIGLRGNDGEDIASCKNRIRQCGNDASVLCDLRVGFAAFLDKGFKRLVEGFHQVGDVVELALEHLCGFFQFGDACLQGVA